MSIRDIQTKNALDFIAESFFINGVNPELDDIIRYMNYYFSQNPVGLPIKVDVNQIGRGGKSNPEVVNEYMAKMIVNVETLYEASAQQVEDMMLFNSILTTQLQRLKIKRDVLEAKIDDYLLGLYNSDGFFYSYSDNFASTSGMDTKLSSAYVDTTSQTLMLPPSSGRFTETHEGSLNPPNISVTDAAGNRLVIDKKTNFKKAIDGLSNTAWFFTTTTTQISPITVVLSFDIARSFNKTKISKIDLTPHGVQPVKIAIEATFADVNGNTSQKAFSSYVKESADKVSFFCEDTERDITKIKLVLVKTKPDVIFKENNIQSYMYMFGFKEIVIAQQAFDTTASYVSKPIRLPSDLSKSHAISAVSLVAQSVTPPGCAIRYYAAADVSGADSVDDFAWKQIQPLSTEKSNNTEAILHFNGMVNSIINIRKKTRTQSDLKLLDLDTTNIDLSLRNPTSTIVPNINVYRLAKFTFDYTAADNLELEEGVNTTRIYYTNLSDDALKFDYWKTKLDTPNSYSTAFGTIDSGHDFFYGGDIGESGKSVYAETYIDVDQEYPIILKDLVKSDPNSKTWSVVLYLNGKKIADLPANKTSISVPWKFQLGRNHIAALIKIPAATDAVPNPYIGTIKLMDDANLMDYGSVKLKVLKFIDPFRFISKLSDCENRFTIYNNEIVTLNKLTDNYRINFKQRTQTGPEAVRLKIDLSRSSQFDKFSPTIDFYRLRFG